MLLLVVHRVRWWLFFHLFIRTKVALQSKTGSTESWAVWTCEIRRCYNCCSSVVMSRSGCSNLLLSCTFKVCSGLVGFGPPLWLVRSTFLQFLRLYMAPLNVGLHSVLVSQLWAALVSPSLPKLTIHQASRHSMLFHSYYMSNPPKLSFDEYGLYACGIGSLKDIQVGNMVFPTDFQYGAECTHKKVL